MTNLQRVPKYLFEQVKGRSWRIERLYKLAPSLFVNCANRFWVLVNDEQAVKGVLWVVIDALSEKLNVIVFSVDKEYQENSLEGARDFLRQFIKDFNESNDGIKLSEKINWVTAQPEIFSEIGGQLPKTVLVEV